MTPAKPFATPFAIFRAAAARDFEESELMTPAADGDIDPAAAGELVAAGVLEGSRVSLLFQRPGMSLAHAWFKSGFPLPRHSHDADCLYLILAGTLRIGTEELAAGDGFFVGSNVPYTYTPGPDGVEVLEFRTTDAFDIRVLANSPAWWGKALATVTGRRESWRGETPPSGLHFGATSS
ncbi:MAG: cupin domain-containing protein [Novosphingobium sp.]